MTYYNLDENGDITQPVSNKNDFYLDISAGNIDGAVSNFVRGRNADIDQGITSDIWDVGGEINQPSSAATIFVSSEDAADTQTLLIRGMDENYNIQIGAVILNGQTKTEVKSLLGASITFLRFFEMINIDSTSLRDNVYIYEEDTVVVGVPQTATKILGKIVFGNGNVSNNRTFNGFFTIPAGTTGFFTYLVLSIGRGKDALIETLTKPENGTWIAGTPFDLFESFEAGEVTPPTALPEKTDLKFRVTANNDDTAVTAVATFITMEN